MAKTIQPLEPTMPVESNIQDLIYVIRGQQVMLDRDLATLYGVETKVLIDNYIDETVLTLLDKRAAEVEATIYTQQISRQLQLDIDRHNAQYPPIDVNLFRRSHDRFLCIDESVYHIGASIKDLGKKWFGFSKMELLTPEELVERINRG